MYRSLVPFILASLGFHIFHLAISTPLFEWQFGKVITDFPPSYEVHTSSLTTILGHSLNDNSYYGKVYVTKDGAICPYEDMDLIVRRSPNDVILESFSLKTNETYIPWLQNLFALAIYLAGIYIWWFSIWYRRPIWESFGLTCLSVLIFLLLSQIVRPFLWRIGPSFGFYGTLDCYHGTITSAVSLAKIHYEMPVILLVGILLELGVFSMMLRQIIRAVSERRAAKN